MILGDVIDYFFIRLNVFLWIKQLFHHFLSSLNRYLFEFGFSFCFQWYENACIDTFNSFTFIAFVYHFITHLKIDHRDEEWNSLFDQIEPDIIVWYTIKSSKLHLICRIGNYLRGIMIFFSFSHAQTCQILFSSIIL